MRKIPFEYDNPIDNLCIWLSDIIQPYLYNIGFTPNGITTLSLITCFVSVYYLYHGYYITSAILFFVAYYFDCLDGHMARSYDMVTDFGDYYDHFGDMIKHLVLFYALWSIDSEKFYKVLPIITIVLLLSFVHLSCQEKLYGTHNSNTLNILNFLCPATKDNVTDYLDITKYFGCGTFALVMSLIILYFGI